MKAVAFVYENQSVDFVSTGEDNVMVNATQMAKIFGKRIDRFLRSEHANEFISELELTPFGGRSTPLTRDEIIKTVNGVNTWMHRILALKFAAWLDVKFELWVFSTIDQVILGHYKEVKQATIEKLVAQRQLEDKKLSLLQKYPEFNEFLDLHSKVSMAEKKKSQALKASVEQLKLGLFENQL